jgi:[FeFe] hydrogenase H-cluster maturation GTPase HydF
MSLNSTVSGERPHIAFFGMRNAGKSSVVNAVTGQSLSMVSDIAGTTTDPVSKAMEILPLGPVVIIDTPGIDDVGTLGKMRVERAIRAMDKADAAVLVINSETGKTDMDAGIEEKLRSKNIPYILAYNKSDIKKKDTSSSNEINISAKTKEGIYELKEMMAQLLNIQKPKRPLISDLVHENETAVLVIPIDAAAPKGRLILPQQQTLRELLDTNAMGIVTQVEQLEKTLSNLNKPPKLVITDSQAFKEVDRIVPEDIALTSFSILFARYKGDLDTLINGADKLDDIQDGDKILISEGCTHHRQCGDIGTQKLPALIRRYTGKDIGFEFTSGNEYPSDLTVHKLNIHCGGCMLNEREMNSRIERAADAGLPITNYGIAIAKMNGILDRSLSPFRKEAVL